MEAIDFIKSTFGSGKNYLLPATPIQDPRGLHGSKSCVGENLFPPSVRLKSAHGQTHLQGYKSHFNERWTRP